MVVVVVVVVVVVGVLVVVLVGLVYGCSVKSKLFFILLLLL